LIAARGKTLHDDSGSRPVRMIGTTLDITNEGRRTEVADFLIEATRVLASSLDYRVILESVAKLAVPRLGDWCGIDLLKPDGTPERVAVAHKDRTKVD